MSEVREFRLPDLGEGLEEGEVVRWLVEVDDVVELNQAVVEIETAKAVVEVPSPFAGRVVERFGEVGETLEVGSQLMLIDTSAAEQADGTVAAQEGEQPPTLVGYGAGQDEARAPRRGGRGAGRDPATGGPSAGGAGARPLAKPPVRKLAKELGVDLTAIAPGSGPEGAVTREDVEAAAAGPAAPAGTAARAAAEAPAAPDEAVAAGGGPVGEVVGPPVRGVPGFRGRRPGEVEPIRGIRRRIVDKMELSRREIPEATCSRDADLTALTELRKRLTDQARQDGLEARITPFALVMRATVIALRRFPTLNARIEGREGEEPGRIHLLEHVNLGFAADTDRGLVVPNIKDAHTMSTLELALELTGLAERARDATITPAELTGGTFTVNNYGAFGNDDGDPIINHPEAAILGVGAIRPRPWVVTSPGDDGPGQVAVRQVARFTLAFDHRVCDGGEAGRFVTYLADLCERPGRILLYA